MNRLIRWVATAGFSAALAWTSLTANADTPTPASQPVPQDAPSAPSAGEDRPPTRPSAGEDQPLTRPANDAPSSPLPNGPADSNASGEPPYATDYDARADTDPAALTDFRETLDPYGTWEEDATYGTVWVPAGGVVGAEFTPYVTHGHWGLTAGNSWIWASDFSWGWAPFHYGRWVWIGGRGWAWIPGRVYSPAWVVWRTGYYDDYYVGWAPMPPIWYWRGGFAASLWYVPPAPYVFCSSRYVFAPQIRGYVVPAGRVNAIAPRTRPYISPVVGVAGSSNRMASASRGPTMADAHVPAEGLPAMRASHDARAIAFAHATMPAGASGGRSFSGAAPSAIQSSAFSRPQPGPVRNAFARPVLPATGDVQRPAPPSSLPPSRTFPSSPPPAAPVAPRSFSPVPPVAPRSFSPTPSPVAPRSFSPTPAPVAPRSFSPAPVAPRSFSPAPAPVAPRSFSPAPAVPRSSAPPSFHPRSSPAPVGGRSFGGRR